MAFVVINFHSLHPHILHLFLTCLKYSFVVYVYQLELCKLFLSSHVCYLPHDLIGLGLLSSLLRP